MKLMLVYKEIMELKVVGEGDGYSATVVPADKYTPEQFLVDLSPVAIKGGEGSGNFGHSGRPGKIGGSAKINIQYGMADDVRGILAKYPKLEPFLDNVKEITDTMPKGYKHSPSGGAWLNKSNGRAIGNCETNKDGTHVIHLHPDLVVKKDVLEKTVIHEIGHVAYDQTTQENRNKLYDMYVKVKQAMDEELGYRDEDSDTSEWLSSLNLRNYSMTNWKEFAADVFTNIIYGKSTYNLRSLMYGDEDAYNVELEPLFGLEK